MQVDDRKSVMVHVYGSSIGERMDDVWQKGSDPSLISTSVRRVNCKLSEIQHAHSEKTKIYIGQHLNPVHLLF